MIKTSHISMVFDSTLLLATAPLLAQPAQSMAEVVEEMSQAATAGDLPGKLAAYRQ